MPFRTPHLAAASVLLVSAHFAGAEPATPLPAPAPVSLSEALAQAPALAAARARVEATRARTTAAGRLPNPTLEVMAGQAKEPMGERYPMYEATLAQPLPKAGERAADRDRAAAAVAMTEADYAVMAGDMAMDIAMALAEADTARARSEALEKQAARAEKLLALLDSRVSVGSGRLPERLALQSNIASMRLMIANEQRMAEDALAEARARLALPANAPLPAFAAPSPSEIDDTQLPARRLAAARSAEARAMARMARASARPMTSIGLRLSREEEPMGNMDTISVAFMTELPWRGRRYARAEETAARADERAAHADGAAATARLASALTRVARAERLAETTRRLADETLARLDAEYDSIVRTAGTASMNNESSTLMILEVLERQTDARLQVIDAEAAVRAARAALWPYAPARLLP